MADNLAIAGTAFVAVDGKSYPLVGSGTYQVSGSSREALSGQDGYHGYSQVKRPGKISWTFRDSGAMSVAQLNELSNVTVTLELVNGKTVIARNAVRTGEPLSVNSEEGSGEIEFTSPDVQD